MPSSVPLTPETYLKMRAKLLATFPEAVRAVGEAAANLPTEPLNASNLAGIAAFRLVEKPLYSWMKAKLGGLGDRYSFMWRNNYFPAPEVLAGPDWEITETQRAKRRKRDKAEGEESANSGTKTSAYEAIGAGVKAFRAAAYQPMRMPGYPNMKRPQVALMRLYRMRQIAMNLPDALPAIEAAQQGLVRARTVDDFLREGEGIGERLGVGLTTVFHGLCDMGYEAIKPDMHAARALAHFGKIDSAKAFDHPVAYLSNDRNKARVVCEGVTLARLLPKADLLPDFRGNACREVDIVLMRASLHDVILDF